MWKSLCVRAWTTFVVVVLAPDARAQPAPPPEELTPVAGPPESPSGTTSPPPDGTQSPGRELVSPPGGINEQPPMRRSAPVSPMLPVEQRRRRSVYFVAKGGIDFGGDDVANDPDSTDTLKAGQRYSVSGGVLYQADTGWALEATVGYKWQSSDGRNGTSGMSRIPVEVIGSLTAGGFRFGAGVAVHFSPTFYSKDNEQRVFDSTLDNAIGGVAQIAYHLGDEEGVDFGVRATRIQYDVGRGYPPYDGTCLGFFLGFWL